MSAPIWHDLEGKCLSTYARKAFGDDAAQRRMAIRDRPEWFKLHGYNLDMDERSPVTHPANIPPSSGTTYILNIAPEARNAIYQHLAKNIHVIGICSRPTKYGGTVTFIHPLLYIKSLRREFLGFVERYRMKEVKNFIAIVPDFDFGRIMNILKKNHNFKHGLRRVDLHVYHDITSEQIDSDKLLNWAGGGKFAASNSKQLLVRHAVYNMPKPELRGSFIGKLFSMDHQWYEAPQVSFIIAAFNKWWFNGEGKYDWADGGDSDSDAYDPDEDVVEDDDTSSIGIDLDDANDGLMDYNWDVSENPGPSTGVYGDSFMEFDPEEEAETTGHVLESQIEDDEDDDDHSTSEASHYSELDDEETKVELRSGRKGLAWCVGEELDEEDSDDEMDVEWEGAALEGQSEIEQSRYTMKSFKSKMRLTGEEYY